MLTMRLPQALGFVFPPPDELPESDIRLAWLFRMLGDPPVGEGPSTTAPLSVIPSAERDALMCSLASTLSRSRYCVERFQRTVKVLGDRRGMAGPLQFDTCAKAAVFEAAAAMAAMRSVVDEFVWVAARRTVSPRRRASRVLETSLIAA